MSHPSSFGPACAADCPLAARPVDVAGVGPAAVDRRVFLSRAVLAAAAAALAACGGGGGGDVTAPQSINATLDLASYPPLAAVGDVQTLTISGTPVAVVRTGASSFAALSLVCPHQGTTLDVVSGGFHCPNHGAQFNIAGTWTGGQRASNLTAYPTTYDATTGTLHIG